MKIGGDHGGGSMKSVFQILNVSEPNSCDNTVVWNLFQAKDTDKNLRTAMQLNRDQVNLLDGHEWK